MSKSGSIDRTFLFTVLVLVTVGFFIFLSASLGLLARQGAPFSSVAFNQIALGLLGGTVALIVVSRIPYRLYKPWALYLFLASVFLTLLVFVPGIGFGHNGAHRWLDLRIVSLQPSELMKIGVVLYFAAYLSNQRARLHDIRYGFLPLLGIIGFVGGILLMQPDTGTFLVTAAAIIAMYLTAGAPWRDIFLLGAIALIGIGVLAFFRPYVMDRIETFLDPASDPLGSGYQIQQSLIAIGSGEMFGRGFGQSIQKFDFLPEPIGDSIFSVFAEEFGFIGGVLLITLYVFVALRGLRIASKASDLFGGLIAVGIVILIISQSFVNIGAMVGVVPLTGVPLVFVSHGGTALFIALAEVGILLNISAHIKRA